MPLVRSSSWSAQSRLSRPSRSNLNTLRRPMTPWVAEASKLSEIYVGMARDAYKPVEQAVAERAPKAASVS
jgi:hypothetical protein